MKEFRMGHKLRSIGQSVVNDVVNGAGEVLGHLRLHPLGGTQHLVPGQRERPDYRVHHRLQNWFHVHLLKTSNVK
jgi:hypothetical protein